MKISKYLISILSVVVINPSFAYSTQNLNHLSLSGSIGYMNVESNEYVYDNFSGAKVSQLVWDNQGIAVLRGEANYSITNLLDLNARGWINLGDGSAVMDDYDWLIPNQSVPSHHSHHPDTTLSQANQYDLSLRVWLYQESNFKLGTMAGYQSTYYSFNAQGGCFSYLNGAETGCFPNGLKVIDYQQTFSSPYLGLLGHYYQNNFDISLLFQYSNLVSARDVDQHYLRALTFYDNGQSFEYYNGVINVGYYYNPQWKFFVEGAYTAYPVSVADTTMVNNTTGTYTFFPRGSAGLSNSNYVIALGIQYFIDSGKKEYIK